MADVYICSLVTDFLNSGFARVLCLQPLVGMAATALRGMPGIQLECAGQRGADRRGSGREMTINQTTPHISTPSPTPSFLAYTLIPFLLFTLLLCVAATVSSHEITIIIVVVMAFHF